MILKANQKFIDASHVAHLLAAGEKYADTLTFSVDRQYHGKDLSGCLFVIRGVNSAGNLSLQTLSQETTDAAILLTWNVSPAFTAVSGMLALEIVCYDNESMILKYAVTPMQIRESVLEEYRGSVDAIEEALKEMEQILEQTRTVSMNLPIIQNGTWRLYNTESGAYEDSGQPAQGAAGKDGLNGKDGTDGNDGQDGASAYEIAVSNGFTGTEAEWLASLKGEKGDTGEPGIPGADGAPGKNGTDGLPGTDGQDGADGKSAYEIWLDAGNSGTEAEFLASLKGADGFSPTLIVTKSGSVVTLTVTDKNGITSVNITETEPVDLTPYATIVYVNEQIQAIHTHDNQSVLDNITAVDNALSKTSTNPIQNNAVSKKFEEHLPLTGGTLQTGAAIAIPGTNDRSTSYTPSGVKMRVPSGGWAMGLTYTVQDDTVLSQIGAYGDSGTLKYLYFGGTYDSPLVKLTPDGTLACDRLDGIAASATKLQTARTLTIGKTGKIFDGSANVSWTYAEIAGDSGWENLLLGTTGNVRYRKIGNTVEVQGQYKPASSGGGFTIGALPEGYRPAGYKAVATLPNEACSTFFALRVGTDGVVSISGYSASTFTAGTVYDLHITYFVD